MRRIHNVNILAVKREGSIDAQITPYTVLPKEGTLLALGEYRALKKCFRA